MGLKLSYMGPRLTFSKEALVGEEWNTKDSENVCGTEKASEQKTNSENIEALYERLKMKKKKPLGTFGRRIGVSYL